MTANPAVFERLVDDAAMFPPGNAEVADAVQAHRTYRQAWFSPLIGPLVVADRRLAEVGRAARSAQQAGDDQEDLAVSVVNTGGAGGIASLAGREVPGVDVVAVESALRDLDDLAGNAARVLAAAAELDDAVQIFVEIPYAQGWERAVEEIEAAGRYGKIRTGGPDRADCPSADQLARQLSILIEADLPFKATAGLHHAWPSDGSDPARPRQHGFLTVLAAVEVLVDGATEAEAADLLAGRDRRGLADRVGGWSDARAASVRRRIRSFGCCGILDPVGDLMQLGLVAEPV